MIVRITLDRKKFPSWFTPSDGSAQPVLCVAGMYKFFDLERGCQEIDLVISTVKPRHKRCYILKSYRSRWSLASGPSKGKTPWLYEFDHWLYDQFFDDLTLYLWVEA